MSALREKTMRVYMKRLDFTPDERVVDERGPTVERIKKAWGSIDVGDSGTVTIRQSPIDRAVRRNTLTEVQGRAAEKLYLHWYRSGLGAELGSMDLDRVLADDGCFGHMARTEHAAFHRQRLRSALHAVRERTSGGGHSGDDAVKVLEYIVFREMSIETAGRAIGHLARDRAVFAAETLLRGALNILVREWGL